MRQPCTLSGTVPAALLLTAVLVMPAVTRASEIDQKYAEPAAKRLLGAAMSPEAATADGVGRYRRFKEGVIYWSPATHAHVVVGDILEAWTVQGRERGALGYPITDQVQAPDTPEGNGVVQHNQFQNGLIYRIYEPNVKRRETDYANVPFRNADVVYVDAKGCAQTGGAGKTWKRYVDPQGPNSDRLYHGLVHIPAATAGLVRTQSIQRKRLVIPEKADYIGPMHLILGYEDDGYGDNGYWGREGDDGTGDQCKGLGNATVLVTIVRHGTISPSLALPMDLVSTELDANGLLLNPGWQWQLSHAGQHPNPHQACPHKFDGSCSSQVPSIDTAGFPNNVFCELEGSDIHGHVNWFAATYEGLIAWDSHSTPGTDDDYNFRLQTRDGHGLTAADKDSMGLEFDSDETIDHFKTQWWASFHGAVDDSDAKARAMVDNKFAIVTGLIGLDCEHSCHAESHPVYAMAVRVRDNDPNDEAWAIFVRNWGNEGYCSSSQHYLYLPANAYTLRLPWRPGATSVAVVRHDRDFLTSNSRVSGPDVTIVPGQAVLVTFTLADPQSRSRLNGDLHLRWTGGGAFAGLPPWLGGSRVTAAHALAAADEEGGAEKRAAQKLAGMMPEQRQVFLQRLPQKLSAADGLAPRAGAVRTVQQAPAVGRLSVESARPKVVRDLAKLELENRRFQAMKEAFGGAIPGVRNEEIEARRLQAERELHP